eukprot:7696802-Ditylum_brightwellii.AAC.1
MSPQAPPCKDFAQEPPSFFPPFPAKPKSSHMHQYASPHKYQAYPTFIPLTQMPPPDFSKA